MGKLAITEKQAQQLQIQPHTQWSPYLEKCCLLLSANESYQRASEDIMVLTGISVSRGTQQRLVHRHQFQSAPETAPLQESEESVVEEVSLDGGKVRVRTLEIGSCLWRDYKAVNLHKHEVGAFYRDNPNLIDWVNQHSLGTPLICLGDGHDGIWNLFGQIGEPSQRREILDWYHLMENLGKVGGSKRRLDRVEALLWQGDVEGAIQQFQNWKHERVERFINYLNKHRQRIVNYSYQAEGISIGSGAVESTVKQLGARIKITGAQWKEENIPQVLRHRCAYLNGLFST